MTTNVFQVGDKVYHPTHGEGVVTAVDNGNGPPFCVAYKHGQKIWSYVEFLSFTPWPAPNHERPLKDGLYQIDYEGEEEKYLILRTANTWYWLHGNTLRKGTICRFPEKLLNPRFLCELPK